MAVVVVQMNNKMNLRFNYSRVYFNCLNKHKKVNTSWEDVKRIGNLFEKKYNEEIKKILEIIPSILNKEWEQEEINVYLVDWFGPSFSHPLTLKIRDDTLLMLVILTHELVHYFFMNEPAGKKKEKKINNVVEKVFLKLNINAKKQISNLREISEKI